ncbi:MAG: ATP-binding protein [Desulfobacterales bacterium]
MIDHGDRILVGLSGGLDSQTLFWFLHERRARIPIDYTLKAVLIDPGFSGGAALALKAHYRDLGHEVWVERTDHGPHAHSDANRENPCFMCAKLRRRRMFQIAEDLHCNKIALGHNKDDLIETLFLNICYAGEIAAMHPNQPLFDGRLRIIRPLAMVDQDEIRRFGHQMHFPHFENPCPSAGHTRRSEIKTLLQGLYRANRKTKGNIFRAMAHVNPDYLL